MTFTITIAIDMVMAGLTVSLVCVLAVLFVSIWLAMKEKPIEQDDEDEHGKHLGI